MSSWEDRHRLSYGLRDPLVKRSLFAFVLGAVVLFLVLRGGDRRSFTFSPSTRPLPSLGSVVVIGGALASGHASPAATREAERIAASNATFTRLVRLGDGQRSSAVGPWGGIDGKPLGVVLTYKLKRPVTVNSDLPFVAIPPDAPAHGTCVTPYAPGWAHLRASDVTVLSVLVDLRRDRVAQVTTNAKRGKVSPVAGKPYPTCNEDQSG